jgi:integrase/recombinase XerC
MASLYKPTIASYCLPDGSYRTPEGERVTKATPSAIRVSKRSTVYYGKFTDADGRPQRVKLCKNKEAAKSMLAKLVTDAALGRVGAVDPFEKQNQLPVAIHLEHFESHLRTSTNKRGGKNTEHHVKTTTQRVRSVIDGCGFKRLREISRIPVEQYLHTMEVTRGGKKRKPSAQSRNFYLQAVTQFCRWLVTEDRMPRNPLAKLKKENVDLDQKHKRRAFTSEELPWIFAVTAKSETTFRGLTGADRVALYAVAMGTGFRVKELASLAPKSFDLDVATVDVRGEYTKNRKPVKNRPIPRETAEHLRGYLADKPLGTAIWAGTWTEKAARMVKADLAAARAAWIADAGDEAEQKRREKSELFLYINSEEEFADMHAWRHTMISQLFATGVNLKMAQDLARHSDAKTTLKRYGHTEQAAVVEAINRLPQYLAATGTDGMPSARLDRALTNGGMETAPHQRTTEETAGGIGGCETTPKTLRFMPLEAYGLGEIGTEEDYTRRESNPQPMVPKTIALSS